MEYRRLGKTGIKASVIGMGSEGFVGMERGQALNLISQALEKGVNYFDLYNPQPEVRLNLGDGIKGHQDKVFIQGHLGTAWIRGQYTRTRQLKLVKESFEEMLRMLQTDYVDVGTIHYVDKEEDLDQVFNGDFMGYVGKMKDRGYIRHLGISSHNPVIARKAVETGAIETVLFAVNPAYDMQPASENLELLWAEESYINPLCNTDADRDAFHAYCVSEDVGVTVMKAFGGGDLLNRQLSPFGVALTPVQCIHYALSRPAVASVLGGFRTQEELLKSLRYCDAEEEEKDFAPILSRIPKHTFRGKCMYCGHCAPCPQGIDVASVNKFYDLCKAQGFVPETVREHYKALPHHAGECIRCGSCEKNCPFEVSIMQAMCNAADLFKM